MTERKFDETSDPRERFLIGKRDNFIPKDDHGRIAWEDSKISFITERCKGRSVLDLGCVQHDAEFEKSKFWLHKAIVKVSKECVGLDLYKQGVEDLKKKGYDVVHGNAENFSLGRTFDVIVAGDLIEHLDNVGQFLSSCSEHMGDDGRLIICTPNPWHWHKLVYALFRNVPVNEEHTCWFCPTTLGQIAARYDFKIVESKYGSSRFKDYFLPLPKRLRHSSWYSVLEKK